MNKKCLGLSALLASLVLLTACGSNHHNSLDKIKEKKKLVVAVSPDYAPFEFRSLVNGKSKIVGADIELAQDIADELGVELSLSPMSFNNVLASVKSGKADLAISGISYTKERANVYGFSNSYYDTENTVVIAASQASKLVNIADLKGKKVGVQKGTTQEALAQKELTGSQIVSLTDMGEIINEVKSGQLDAAIMDSPVAIGFDTNNTDIAVMKENFKANAGDAKVIGMAKHNKTLQQVVNKVIKKVKGSTFEGYLSDASKMTEEK